MAKYAHGYSHDSGLFPKGLGTLLLKCYCQGGETLISQCPGRLRAHLSPDSKLPLTIRKSGVSFCVCVPFNCDAHHILSLWRGSLGCEEIWGLNIFLTRRQRKAHWKVLRLERAWLVGNTAKH